MDSCDSCFRGERETIENKKLFASLFIVQLLASFLVCAGHYTASVVNFVEPTLWETALNRLSRYGTVFLAIITGFFTAYSLTGKQTSGAAFFTGKLVYIYLPFLMAGVIYHRILHGAWPHFQHHFEYILLGKTGTHLYFVFMLCQYYLFAYLMRKLINKHNLPVLLCFFLVLQFLFVQKFAGGRFDLDVRHFFPTWIFTIYAGHVLYEYRQEIFSFLEKQRWFAYFLVLLSLGSATFFALTEALYSANHLRFVLSALIILVTMLFFLNKVIERIKLPFQKGLTFYIYLTHSIFILYTNKLVIGHWGLTWILENKLASTLYLLFIFLLTLAVSLSVLMVNDKASLLLKKKQRKVSSQEVSA